MTRFEAATATAIAAVAVAMAATPPARGPDWFPSAVQAPIVPTISGQADDLLVTLSIRPNQGGRNFVSVGVFDTRRPEPAPIDRVILSIEPGTGTPELALQSVGGGRYEAAVDLAGSSDATQLSVNAERIGLPDAIFTAPWIVSPPAAAAGRERPVVVSRDSLRQPLVTAAAVLAMVFISVLVGVILRGRGPWRTAGRPTPVPIAVHASREH